MRAWITVELSPKEVDSLLDELHGKIIERFEDVSKTPLEMVVRHAYALMVCGQEVRLTITNMKRPQGEA